MSPKKGGSFQKEISSSTIFSGDICSFFWGVEKGNDATQVMPLYRRWLREPWLWDECGRPAEQLVGDTWKLLSWKLRWHLVAQLDLWIIYALKIQPPCFILVPHILITCHVLSIPLVMLSIPKYFPSIFWVVVANMFYFHPDLLGVSWSKLASIFFRWVETTN